MMHKFLAYLNMNLYQGNWNPKLASGKEALGEEEFKRLANDKMANNIVADLRKHLPPGGFQSKATIIVESKPVVTSKLGKPVVCKARWTN